MSDETTAERPTETGAGPVLLGIPENPVPDWARPGFFIAPDGKRLRYAVFPARARPLKGTVLLLSGRNECIEKYFETIRDLNARGFWVATFDWRGQGGSDRLIRDPERGYVESFDEHVADLDRFFTEIALPDCPGPFFILAHSTGGLATLLAAPLFVNRVRRIVLSAPLLALADTRLSMTALGRLSGVLFALGLGAMYLGWGKRPDEATPFAANKVTSDVARYARNTELYRVHPQLGLGGPTVAWFRAVCRAAERVKDPDFMGRIQVPVLMIAAGADKVVSTPEIEAYAQRLRSGAVLTIDGAAHEMLQEQDFFREQLLAAFDAFVPGSDA